MANFADLLAKIANNARLTPMELDELKRFGTDTQQRNSQVSNWATQTFTNSDPSLRQLDFRTQGVKVQATTSVAHSTNTYASFDSILYNDDSMFSLSDPTKIYIPRTGRYWFGAYADFDGSTNVYTLRAESSSGTFYGNAIGEDNIKILNFTEDGFFSKGDFLRLKLFQFTGGTISVFSQFFVRWLGTN